MSDNEYKPLVIDILSAYGNVRCKACRLVVARYRDNANIAIQAMCTDKSVDAYGDHIEDGEVWGMLTVNTGETLDDDHICIKDYSEGEGNLNTLRTAGLVDAPERWISSGFVNIPVCKLTEKGLAWIKAELRRLDSEDARDLEKAFKFGGVSITRLDYEGLPLPMAASELPDDEMQQIAEDIYGYLIGNGWDSAEITSCLASFDEDDEKANKLKDDFWKFMEKAAVEHGMRYYEQGERNG